MKRIGLTSNFESEAKVYSGFYVGRILSQSKDLYQVMCESGEIKAEISGKFRFEVKSISDFPAVGDFVMLDKDNDRGGNSIIHHVLSRKSAFIRRAAGTSNDEQVVASNIDTVFLCMSLNNDFNLRRLERYVSIGWNSGALPVVVLTKSDLCEDIEKRLYEVNTVSIGVNVVVTSAIGDKGYLEIKRYIKEGQTVAFIGSSGVGKSTLINCLIGEERQNRNGLRNDDKGRHTTTKRELFLLNNGGMVIDTPGMRELGLENANLSKTFMDIDELASKCKFRDCQHNNEPGCAVKQAIHDGYLSLSRLLNYQKLQKEVKYEGLGSRQIENIKINEMFSSVGGMKKARKFAKEKNQKR